MIAVNDPQTPTSAVQHRHYWLPVVQADGVVIRHAFRGLRWEGQTPETTVCGTDVAMAKPSEVDWLRSSCQECNAILRGEQDA